MEIAIHSVLIILTLFLIVGCCVVFTNAVEHMGKLYNLGDGAVGSILAAVGTALPETIVPLVAILGAYISGSDVSVGEEIGVGAILGSPFLLSTLAMFVTGVAVIIFRAMKKREHEMTADYTVMFRDLRFFFLSYTVAICTAFVPFKAVKYFVAVCLLTYYFVYVFRTINKSKSENNEHEEEELDELYLKKLFKVYNIFVVWVQVFISIGALIYFSHIFVEQIKYFAGVFSINPLVLSLLLAPIATELPEIFNSVLWVSQKKDTLALGNITGAMVFQSCIPTAIGILLTPWVFATESLVNIVLVYLSTIVLFVNLFRNKAFSAHILVTCGLFYFVYIIFIFKNVLIG